MEKNKMNKDGRHLSPNGRMMVNDNSKKRINKLRRFQSENTYKKSVNYCIPDIMSRCGAGNSWLEQKKCKFAIKSSVSNRCMYYIESIYGHCDCLEAQLDSREKK